MGDFPAKEKISNSVIRKSILYIPELMNGHTRVIGSKKRRKGEGRADGKGHASSF